MRMGDKRTCTGCHVTVHAGCLPVLIKVSIRIGWVVLKVESERTGECEMQADLSRAADEHRRQHQHGSVLTTSLGAQTHG
jgi:hypothetical protein